MKKGSDKGEIYNVARSAGILAGKKTSELIPLCHNINLTLIEIDFKVNEKKLTIEVISKVKSNSKTGVEMEALTACSIASLTIYDMCKSIDKEIKIVETKLIFKSGGKSGFFPMISYNKAKSLIQINVKKSKKTEFVDLFQSNKRILSENIKSKVDQPRLDLSAMDGMVIFERDYCRDKFRLIGESKAGDKFSNDFKTGEAKLIFTGAPVPGTKKIIIPKENFTVDENKKEIKINKKINQNFIRKKGIDFKKNQECLFKNAVMNLRSMALAKSMKVKRLNVKKKPEIYLIVTGDELITQKNKSGLIESSNEILISHLISKFGGKLKKKFLLSETKLMISKKHLTHSIILIF